MEKETKLSLDGIISKMVAFNPEDRYNDLGEVLIALNELDKYNANENNCQKKDQYNKEQNRTYAV